MLPSDWDKIYPMHRYPIKLMLEALKDYNVRLICFGSTIKGTATWRSDIDIAYTTADSSIEVRREVHRILACTETAEGYPFFDTDIIDTYSIKKGTLLEEINKGMLLKDWW